MSSFHAPRLAAAFYAALIASPSGALAQNDETADVAAPSAVPSIGVELNRTQDVDGACRAYFIVDNANDATLALLELDTFLFDPDGIIDQRVLLAFEGVGAGRRKVALFDLATSCDRLGSVLINEVTACQTPDGALEGCAEGLTASARGATGFDF